MKNLESYLNIGEQKGIVLQYKCKNCGKIFHTDVKSIADENYNITIHVIDYINDLHFVFGNSIYKIKHMLNIPDISKLQGHSSLKFLTELLFYS